MLKRETLLELERVSLPSFAHIEELIWGIDFEVFSSQVLAYLEPHYQEYYASRQRWEEMQLEVIERLKELLCS